MEKSLPSCQGKQEKKDSFRRYGHGQRKSNPLCTLRHIKLNTLTNNFSNAFSIGLLLLLLLLLLLINWFCSSCRMSEADMVKIGIKQRKRWGQPSLNLSCTNMVLKIKITSSYNCPTDRHDSRMPATKLHGDRRLIHSFIISLYTVLYYRTVVSSTRRSSTQSWNHPSWPPGLQAR